MDIIGWETGQTIRRHDHNTPGTGVKRWTPSAVRWGRLSDTRATIHPAQCNTVGTIDWETISDTRATIHQAQVHCGH